ncbi:hypothetical protein ONZ45_g125 [Pleurotus djamor]|nr:hypothetical protein ONZ45_g125 [Pleurotus djamor]
MNRLAPSLSRSAIQSVSPEELLDAVSGAASQDPVRVKDCSARLKLFLEVAGTYDLLHEIAIQRQLPLAVRQQAIIQFKNGALGHWRSRKLLSEEQRGRIRARCLLFVDEQDDVIADCNEVIVSKIARYDFANNWANLLSELMALVDSNLQARYSSPIDDPNQTLILRRSLYLLNAVIKELSSVKMLNGVKIMTKVVDDLRAIFQGYYTRICTSFSNPSMTAQELSSQRIYTDMMLGHVCFKSLIKMTLWAWQRYERTTPQEQAISSQWLGALFSSCAGQLQTLFNMRKSILSAVPLQTVESDPHLKRSIDLLTRHIRAFGKYFRRLQQLNNKAFLELPGSAELILYYWAQVSESINHPPEALADSNLVLYPVRFLVQAMSLFKENLPQWRKQGNQNLTPGLTNDFVERAVELLVTRFIPLHPSDLERWMEDPEEWVSEESKESDHWEYEIRACSERVLMSLASQYQPVVVPLLKRFFEQMALQIRSDLQGIIEKEALYCALGRCAGRLKDTIPFDSWLQTTLIVEARDPHPSSPIIKRRIAWLIGKWVNEQCTTPNNPHIWQILLQLLRDRGPGTDSVVRLTAAVALGECVDSLEFRVDSFVPSLPDAVAELLKILGEVEISETKRRIAKTLNIIVQQSGTHVTPLAPAIANPIPSLWNQAAEDWIFKATLLEMVTILVGAIKAESVSLTGLVVPLLRECLLPVNMAHLDEDAFTLWLAALRNATTLQQNLDGSPSLLDLFPSAMNVFTSNLDLLGSVTEIVTSYLFLNSQLLLMTYGAHVFQAFAQALQSGGIAANIKQMIIALEFIIQLTPPSLWAESMHVSGLFTYLISKINDPETGSIILTELIYLFARMILADRQMFAQLMSASASAKNVPENTLYEGLLDQWWSKFDAMSEARYRKLTAMGIAALVANGHAEVLKRLTGDIFNIWLDVLGELKEADTDFDDGGVPSPSNLRRYWELDEAPDDYYANSAGTPEYERRKALYDRDPVRVVKLNEFVDSQLLDLKMNIGFQNFQNCLVNADDTVLRQLQVDLRCSLGN